MPRPRDLGPALGRAAPHLVFFAAAWVVSTRFGTSATLHWFLAGTAAATALAAGWRARGSRPRLRAAAWALPAAATIALACRLPIERQPVAGPGAAAAAAERADRWLSDRSRELADAARLLARAPKVAAAVEGSDAGDLAREAHRALTALPLPSGPLGVSGATLYDRDLRPVVWSGANPDLEPALRVFFPGGVRTENCPDAASPLLFAFEHGRRRWFAAAECLRNRLGLVTVEFPIAESPPPSSGSRTRSALEVTAGRSMEVELLRAGEDPDSLARLFERQGDTFREGPAEAERFFFALRAPNGQLLGAANTAVAPAAAKQLERRAAAALLGALALLAGAILAVLALRRSGSAAPARGPAAPIAETLAAIWEVRFALGALLHTGSGWIGALFPDAPLLTPGAGAPPLLGLPDTPLDQLLTGLALFLSTRALGPRCSRALPAPGGRGAAGLLLARGGGAGLALLGAAAMVAAAGEAGNLRLAPGWEAGTGTAQIASWTALLLTSSALVLLAAQLLRPHRWALSGAAAVLLPAAAFSPERALIALLPLLGAALTVLSPRGRLALRQLRRPLLSQQAGASFVLALSVFAGPVLLLYPALHLQEESARRRYTTDLVPRLLATRALSVCYAATEAARALDAAFPRAGDLRQDTAYRLWRATGLARTTAASALEVRGEDGAVSRFNVGFPRRAAPPESAPAPPEWAGLGACPGSGRPAAAAASAPWPAADSGEPAVPPRPAASVITARRRYPSRRTLTLTVAARPGELGLAPRPAGTSEHFRLGGGALPAVLEGHDFRVEPAPGAPPEPDRRRFEAGGAPADPGAFAGSWRRTGAAGHAAALAGWVLLAALLALLTALSARLRSALPGPPGRRRRRSFQMQLTEAFAGAVLIAILGLAVFAERRLSASLESERAEDALARAHTARRVASEWGALDPERPEAELISRLALTADQVDADAALYAGGRLVAASRPELVHSGLLPARPPAGTAFGAPAPLLLEEEAGPLRYRIAWIPVESPGRPAPGGPTLLAIPLPADATARIAGVRAMQQALLFGSGSLALIFAFLIPWFFARRLAAPVRRLSHATNRIADGRPDTPVPVHGTVDELRLLAAGVERLARRVPSVQRRMREEATVDLARRVAHDIRNALAPIGIAADFIRRVLRDPRGRDPKPAVEESVGDILGQVSRLRRLSSEFSALGAPLRLREVDLGPLVRTTLAPWRRSATGPEISFRADGPAPVRADPEIVARIVENLLQNAIEAVEDARARPGDDDPEGGIEVRVFGAGASGGQRGRVRLEVADHGPGVAEELRERIFDAAFSTRTRGSGLGLANARRFAEAHGGRVRAGPRRDGRRGLLLTVEFPTAGPPPGREDRRPDS